MHLACNSFWTNIKTSDHYINVDTNAYEANAMVVPNYRTTKKSLVKGKVEQALKWLQLQYYFFYGTEIDYVYSSV